jgi:chloramphenicol-sensitive protein RarD
MRKSIGAADTPGDENKRLSQEAAGNIYTLAAFGLWGVVPLYFKLVSHLSTLEVLGHRIVWAFVFSWGYLLLRGKLSETRAYLRSPRVTAVAFLRAALIFINWFTFLYAVGSRQVLAASLGYYINPLVSVLAGILLLKERLTRLQLAALILAFAGVCVMTIGYGKLPWISLALAGSFGTYGILKKKISLDTTIGLGLEFLFLLPAGAGIILFFGSGGHFAENMATASVLTGAGLVTLLPLLWFAHGTARIPLSRVGFFQYIAPTLQFFTGILFFRESFEGIQAVSFIIIWLALCIYSVSLYRNMGRSSRED